MATKKRKSKRAPAKKVPAGIHYYDAVPNWRKIARHSDNVIFQNVLVENFNKYTYGRARQRFHHGQCPRDFESADWSYGWKHWLVNLNRDLLR